MKILYYSQNISVNCNMRAYLREVFPGCRAICTSNRKIALEEAEGLDDAILSQEFLDDGYTTKRIEGIAKELRDRGFAGRVILEYALMPKEKGPFDAMVAVDSNWPYSLFDMLNEKKT